MIPYAETNRMKYNDLRLIALDNGVKDDKITIGIWAKLNGYKKKQSKDRNRKSYCYYIKMNNQDEHNSKIYEQ